MQIDWFTIGAQALNFIILVWLLKRFLYRPILDALDAREQQIADTLAEADRTQAEAAEEREQFQRRNREFDQQRAGLLTEAREEAETERRRLLEEARQAADDARAKWQDALRREQRGLDDEVARWTREEVFAIARRVLDDLAGEDLESSMGEAFVRQLGELDRGAKEELARALAGSSVPARVRSAFPLSTEHRTAIERILAAIAPGNTGVRFETAPDVISGIELSANGQKVAWSIAQYLAALEQRVADMLATQAAAPAGAPAGPGGSRQAAEGDR